MKEPIYLHEWAEGKFFQMVADFDGVYISEMEYEAQESPYPNREIWLSRKEEMKQALEKDEYKDIDVLLASYESSGYEGSAYVLFRKDGRFYEVSGGHCSCYGLEGQWEPEETSVLALQFRMDKGRLGQGENTFANELRQVLAELEV